jgi:competence protein ComGF
MADRTNLVVLTLLRLSSMIRFENLLQTLNSYFVHSRTRHLEFTKIAKFIQTKGNKILQNVKTMWISMLSPLRKSDGRIQNFVGEMALDYFTN